MVVAGILPGESRRVEEKPHYRTEASDDTCRPHGDTPVETLPEDGCKPGDQRAAPVAKCIANSLLPSPNLDLRRGRQRTGVGGNFARLPS